MIEFSTLSNGGTQVTESEFNDLVDETLEALEDALDEVDQELDYENAGGVLTVEFENRTTMVFSRQPPTQELWLAARSGGRPRCRATRL